MKSAYHRSPREDQPLIHKKTHQTTNVDNIRYSVPSFVILLLIFIFGINQSHHKDIKSIPPLQKLNTITQHINEYIYPGQIFRDIDNEPINAHGGGFLHFNDTYYWYGEIKRGETYLPPSNADWGGTRVDFVGISCYASDDLLNWRKCNTFNVFRDLNWSQVGERPKVVYNAKTETFVMWLHVDSMDYGLARCGVATSKSPEGPFTYLESFRPGGQMARDLTVFVDDDSKAYLFTSSEDNSVMHVFELSDDYLHVNGTFARVFIGDYIEAPTVFKKDGMYYFIGSGCTAWMPNAAHSAVASSIWGPWKSTGNPCRGENANTTFYSQPTFVINTSNRYGSFFIFAADRWNMHNLSDSRYVWLPITFDNTNEIDVSEIKWLDHWTPLEIT
jgi:hypothetical protein